jgi:hypothetical protein
MHLASQSAIDTVIKAIQTEFNGKCFVRELRYLGSDANLFLSRLNPEAEICLIAGGHLFSKFEDRDEEEMWAWKPETGWYEVLTNDDFIHPWEFFALNGVDSPSTLGGIDGEDPFS